MNEDRPLSDEDYRALARFRHALRVFLRFSEDAARAAGPHPRPAPAAAGHPGLGRRRAARRSSDVADLLQLSHHSAGRARARAPSRPAWSTTAPDPGDGRRQLPGPHRRGRRPSLAALSLLHRDELRRFRDEMTEVLRELD